MIDLTQKHRFHKKSTIVAELNSRISKFETLGEYESLIESFVEITNAETIKQILVNQDTQHDMHKNTIDHNNNNTI